MRNLYGSLPALLPEAFTLAIVLLVFPTGLRAQESAASLEPGQHGAAAVVVTVHPDFVRLTAPAGTLQMRIVVFNSAQEKVFDSGLLPGDSLDWSMQDEHGVYVPDGFYPAVISTRDQSGKLTSANGTLTISRALAPRVTAAQSKDAGSQSEAESLNGATPQSISGSSGTAGMIAKWLDSTTLGNSVMAESNQSIGINTVPSSSTLEVLQPQPPSVTGKRDRGPVYLSHNRRQGW